MLDLRSLTNLPYLLDLQPEYGQLFLKTAAAIFGALLIIGIVMSIMKPSKKVAWTKPISHWLLWLSGIGLGLIFSDWQGLAYLDLRIIWLVVGFGFSLWLLWIIWPLRRPLSKSPESETERYNSFEKYLPRPKRLRA